MTTVLATQGPGSVFTPALLGQAMDQFAFNPQGSVVVPTLDRAGNVGQGPLLQRADGFDRFMRDGLPQEAGTSWKFEKRTKVAMRLNPDLVVTSSRENSGERTISARSSGNIPSLSFWGKSRLEGKENNGWSWRLASLGLVDNRVHLDQLVVQRECEGIIREKKSDLQILGRRDLLERLVARAKGLPEFTASVGHDRYASWATLENLLSEYDGVTPAMVMVLAAIYVQFEGGGYEGALTYGPDNTRIMVNYMGLKEMADMPKVRSDWNLGLSGSTFTFTTSSGLVFGHRSQAGGEVFLHGDKNAKVADTDTPFSPFMQLAFSVARELASDPRLVPVWQPEGNTIT